MFTTRNGKALLSWRVQLLPYIEGVGIYNQFRLDEPWDSPHNLKLAKQMPQVFASPDSPELAAQGKTRFLALAGKETLFPGNKKLSFATVTDGASNTLMFVRAAPSAAVSWTKPADIEYDPTKPFQGIRSDDQEFAVAMCDGSCQWVPMYVDKEVLKAIATRAGGEVVNLWEYTEGR